MTRPAPASDSGARDLLADRRLLVDAVLPPIVFVVAEAVGGLRAGAIAALGLSAVVLVARLLRRERPLYAVSGMAGVALGVGIALWSGDAAGFFLPGILGNAAMAIVSVVSILARRPLIAWTSAAIYRWPIEWYWHPRVRPAYSEITWAWAALYAVKAVVQFLLADAGQLGWLAVARVATSWPAFAVLLVATYAYVNRRLAALGGPSVEEFQRRGPAAPTPAVATRD